jgi:hypothetical protein
MTLTKTVFGSEHSRHATWAAQRLIHTSLRASIADIIAETLQSPLLINITVTGWAQYRQTHQFSDHTLASARTPLNCLEQLFNIRHHLKLVLRYHCV